MGGNPDDPFTYEEFCIIFGVAILAIIVNAINDFLQRNQNEERTVAVHAQSCKGAGAKVEAFTDQGSSSLLNASLKDRRSAAKKIVDQAILDQYINVQDKFGNVALHNAARGGHLNVVKHYLANAKSMDLNIQDNGGNTPLHTACENGNIDVAKALLTAGANQNIENKEKKKPLQVAKPEVVTALIKLLSNKRGGWNNKRGGFDKSG